MTHLTLIQAEADDAWYEHATLQRLKEQAVAIEARIQVIEFRQTPAALDLPDAA